MKISTFYVKFLFLVCVPKAYLKIPKATKLTNGKIQNQSIKFSHCCQFLIQGEFRKLLLNKVLKHVHDSPVFCHILDLSSAFSLQFFSFSEQIFI